LAAIIEAVYNGRGIQHVLPLSDHIVRCLTAVALRKDPGLPHEKTALRAVENIVTQAAVGVDGHFHATRTRRLLTMLAETPAVDELGNLVRINKRKEPFTLEVVERPKDAANAREVYELWVPIDDTLLGRLETSKITKLDSIRSSSMVHLRNTVPDIGCAIATTALSINGYTSNGMPITDLLRTNFPTISWVENVISDLRSILTDEDEASRGYLFITFVEGENAMEIEEYAALAEELETIKVVDGAPTTERDRVRAKYMGKKAHFDGLKAKWKAVQRDIDVIQQEALAIADNVLAYVRFKRDEKEYARSVEAMRAGNNEPEPAKAGPKVVAPTKPRVARQSEMTPDSAAALVRMTSDTEIELSAPMFNAVALGLSEVANKRDLLAIGLDGGRECLAIYPGVVWEAVIGPMDHALDIDRIETDVRMVVIAPRRVGNMGLDMSQARMLMVHEYENYFSPVVELE
jgi:hypothetical protein